MQIKHIKIDKIKPYENNPRNNEKAIDYVEKSIREFGFQIPIVIDKDSIIVCGHTRYEAAKRIGLNEIPCVIASDLSDEQVRAFRIIDNKSQEQATWDIHKLDEEIRSIIDTGFNLDDFQFSIPEMNSNDFEMLDLNQLLKETDLDLTPKHAKTKKKMVTCPDCGKQFEVDV